MQRMLLLIGPLEANKATHELAGWALRSNSEGSLCFDLSPTRLVKGRLFISCNVLWTLFCGWCFMV